MTEQDYVRRERENIVEFDGKESPEVARRVVQEDENRAQDQAA
jgi:hypothetical protein